MFFGTATFGLTALNFFAETLPLEFVGTKADLLAEMALSLVWKVHVVSVTLLKVRIVRLVFQKHFLVLLVRFQRRCLFHVVSLSSRCETTPDLSASKYIEFIVFKILNNVKSTLWVCKLTNCSRGIRNAWHFYYALNLVIKVVCGGFCIALLTP